MVKNSGDKMQFAEVIVDIVTDAVDRAFHYRVPEEIEEEVHPGSRVIVPFGARQIPGYVWKLIEKPEVEKVKNIVCVDDESVALNEEFLELIPWFCYRYYCRTIEAINMFLPPGYERMKNLREKYAVLTPESKQKPDDFWKKMAQKAPRQNEVMQIMLREEELSRKNLIKETGVTPTVINELIKKGLLKIEEREPSFHLFNEKYGEKDAKTNVVLTHEQEEIIARIFKSLKEQKQDNFLIHGVTGSGKTEVYLECIKECLKQEKSAIVLVPEIALTPQMVAYFKNRLPGEVALLHSQLPQRERYNQWFRIKSGQCRVVLGTRSAIFAPLNKPGLIIIDEEQENSYKQEETPRYHAREVAQWRANYNGAVLVMGSATPSIETYWKARSGQMQLLEMKKRATPFSLPGVEIVDMREELRSGNRNIFSRVMFDKISRVLSDGEQVLLFVNRRGFSNFVLCRECGHVVRCPHCSVSLTFHAAKKLMICHYCFYVSGPPEICPECRSTYIKYFGVGTQRVEEEVNKLFPERRVLRMDRDTTTRQGTHKHLWKEFREGKAQILVGTQMVAKGMDFPGVTLVGVVAADTGIHLPDFRASERTFQLIAQVSGRAGRGGRKGEVIIQTYHPGHYSIACVKEHDYNSFYEEEIRQRHELAYPPFSELLRFLFVSESEGKGHNASLDLARLLENLLEKEENNGNLEILGPAPAPLFKIKKYYRYQLIIKGENINRLSDSIRKVVRKFKNTWNPSDVRLVIDFNPQVML